MAKSKLKWLPILAGATIMVGVFFGGSDALRAQNQKAPTPEEVSVKFMEALIEAANDNLHTDIHFSFDEAGPVARKSWHELNENVGKLMQQLSQGLKQSKTKAHIASLSANSARVKFDGLPSNRDVVLLKENGVWKVDLAKTCAAWKIVSEAEAKKPILSRPDK